MNKKPTSSKPIEEIMSELFYDMLKSAGFSMDVVKLDQLRIKCDTLSKAINKYAYDSSIEAIIRLQKAIGEAFKDMAKDMNEMRETSKKTAEDLLKAYDEKIERELKILRDSIEKGLSK